jgi:hypothetical protein
VKGRKTRELGVFLHFILPKIERRKIEIAFHFPIGLDHGHSAAAALMHRPRVSGGCRQILGTDFVCYNDSGDLIHESVGHIERQLHQAAQSDACLPFLQQCPSHVYDLPDAFEPDGR